jgi:hypothetical protein
MDYRTDVLTMIHPVLTVLFDIFLIGSTLSIIAAIAAEQYLARDPAIGSPHRSHRVAPATPVRHRAARPRRRLANRRGAMVRSW